MSAEESTEQDKDYKEEHKEKFKLKQETTNLHEQKEKSNGS